MTETADERTVRVNPGLDVYKAAMREVQKTIRSTLDADDAATLSRLFDSELDTFGPETVRETHKNTSRPA